MVKTLLCILIVGLCKLSWDLIQTQQDLNKAIENTPKTTIQSPYDTLKNSNFRTWKKEVTHGMLILSLQPETLEKPLQDVLSNLPTLPYKTTRFTIQNTPPLLQIECQHP